MWAESHYLTEQLKTTRYSDIIISKKNIIFFKELLYLNKTLTGYPLNHILVHLIIRTIWRVPMGLAVKIPIVKPLGAKIDKF